LLKGGKMSDFKLSIFELQEMLVCGRLLLDVLERGYEPTLEEKKRILNYLKLMDKLESVSKGVNKK
jgi:hypothetical protein